MNVNLIDTQTKSNQQKRWDLIFKKLSGELTETEIAELAILEDSNKNKSNYIRKVKLGEARPLDRE